MGSRMNWIDALAKVIAEGVGNHLGIDVVWSMRARSDGAFCETLTSKHWKSKLGYSGVPGSHCWEVGLWGKPYTLHERAQQMMERATTFAYDCCAQRQGCNRNCSWQGGLAHALKLLHVFQTNGSRLCVAAGDWK